jgi:hypothetical protein
VAYHQSYLNRHVEYPYRYSFVRDHTYSGVNAAFRVWVISPDNASGFNVMDSS